ncbi:hypothetical protein Q3G72_035380 [Acer saccharum]|nr:hypothetical protein Q3G72_011742 [Acer saccharum]KAK1589575.1 hypothetical protein Q3G72_035380 [Acer saccharum]
MKQTYNTLADTDTGKDYKMFITQCFDFHTSINQPVDLTNLQWLSTLSVFIEVVYDSHMYNSFADNLAKMGSMSNGDFLHWMCVAFCGFVAVLCCVASVSVGVVSLWLRWLWRTHLLRPNRGGCGDRSAHGGRGRGAHGGSGGLESHSG